MAQSTTAVRGELADANRILGHEGILDYLEATYIAVSW